MTGVSNINWSNQASVYKSLQSLQYELACESINWSANLSICHINIARDEQKSGKVGNFFKSATQKFRYYLLK